MSSTEPQFRIHSSALALLDQGAQILRTVPPEIYRKRIPLAFEASIGGHYRHCLDHYTSFLRSLDQDVIDYDVRDRDPGVETDPDAAGALTQQLRERFEASGPQVVSGPIAVRTETSYETGQPPVTHSTRERELTYIIAHTVHHYAIIAIMAGINGVRLDPSIGLAPSTADHRRTAAKGEIGR